MCGHYIGDEGNQPNWFLNTGYLKGQKFPFHLCMLAQNGSLAHNYFLF